MSKIEEMAEKEVPIRAWDDNIITDWCRQIYCLGANAVLKEIEQLVSKFDTHPGYQYNDLYIRMKDKIRELKGE